MKNSFESGQMIFNEDNFGDMACRSLWLHKELVKGRAGGEAYLLKLISSLKPTCQVTTLS